MAQAKPYLSVVATSRNDDHGGTLLRRTQTFVNALIGQCQRHGLPAELVLVEWNPPGDRPRLAQVLKWPANTRPCRVRIIEVPHALHRRLAHSEALPLFQMIGKNVGIRRAEGQFIVCTNIDILLSDELVRFIAGRRLQHGRMYRLDRHDVMADVPVDAPLREQMKYCQEHLIRVNAREGTFHLAPDGRRALAPKDIATPEVGVHFGPGWYAVEQWQGESLRWAGQDAELLVQAAAGPQQAFSLEIEPGPGVGNQPFELQVHAERGQTVARGIVACRVVVSMLLPLRPGQSGRFTLHAVGAGLPAANDPRLLNFRVFRCAWRRPGKWTSCRRARSTSRRWIKACSSRETSPRSTWACVSAGAGTRWSAGTASRCAGRPTMLA